MYKIALGGTILDPTLQSFLHDTHSTPTHLGLQDRAAISLVAANEVPNNNHANRHPSNLREIPDHQELFLSPETLSNLIIEINQRVSQEDALSTFATLSHQQPTLAAGSGSGATATAETVNQAAALHHLHDLCDEGDVMQVVLPPQRAALGALSASPTGAPISAYKGVVQFTSSRQRGARVSTSAADAAVAGAVLNGEAPELTTKLTCHYLLVRLEAQETDLLVLFNVPHEEFDKNGDPRGLSREETVAEDTIKALVERLDIRDWELFV
ncbi:Mog1/PsbP alpha/beta/alpha sandwich [Penicillium hispanicum]|uniref:Mog1/PsbP alpha/beta/alpha sandwich n=1 Tax=Penicillium hispanicum TaxID=1080232 RepID=UPI00254179C9|nr:Mog1/PsbP alpha/beta/alpha sandwich [Penicillium hispanicum]KAJ5570542.1 Mog1/PsbP alpha/beta/alpha sandwich [Penicillium hispanicum]